MHPAPKPPQAGEFDLIDRFFKSPSAATPATAAVRLGIGDDCALLRVAEGQELAISCDILLEGRHFLPDADPAALGHKALAVNLSDLAAMGAQPLAFVLALALPAERAGDALWMQAFSQGLLTLAQAHDCQLIGGDTTRGPLNICITVFGQVPSGQALRRDGAQAGDDIWVSGHLGDARLALDVELQRLSWPADWPQTKLDFARQRMQRPTPRVQLGLALRELAHSAIDVSDGLLGDLQHILQASGLGASLHVDQMMHLPGSRLDWSHLFGPDAQARLRQLVLAGGDDYELLFTAPAAARQTVEQAARKSRAPVHRIGSLETPAGLRLLDASGQLMDAQSFAGFDHFASP